MGDCVADAVSVRDGGEWGVDGQIRSIEDTTETREPSYEGMEMG